MDDRLGRLNVDSLAVDCPLRDEFCVPAPCCDSALPLPSSAILLTSTAARVSAWRGAHCTPRGGDRHRRWSGPAGHGRAFSGPLGATLCGRYAPSGAGPFSGAQRALPCPVLHHVRRFVWGVCVCVDAHPHARGVESIAVSLLAARPVRAPGDRAALCDNSACGGAARSRGDSARMELARYTEAMDTTCCRPALA